MFLLVFTSQGDLLPYQVADVSIGASHWMARTVEGACFAFGESECGALGQGPERRRIKRAAVLTTLTFPGVAVSSVSCGSHTTVFVAGGHLLITGDLSGCTAGSLRLVPAGIYA